MTLTLNEGQEKAKAEILRAKSTEPFHLLTGFAGSGKTTLVQHLAAKFAASGIETILTAPTHKAVSVLSRKLGNIGVECQTIHSLLSLMPKSHGDKLTFERKETATPVDAKVVVVDECSMVNLELMRHIRRHLTRSFVLFVGDPAQLPPVNETESQTFGTRSKSHLDTIVRQGVGNPILDAADAIRKSQGGEMDWSWLRCNKAPPLGVYTPASPDEWMRKAFTSAEFAEDADAFRYLCWTNERVADVNRKVRRWIYGPNIPTPFMPGERVLSRSPLVGPDGQTPLLITNEEATTVSIEPDEFTFRVNGVINVIGWTARLPSWRLVLRKDNAEEIEVHMPRDERTYTKILGRMADEAADNRERWEDYHQFKRSVARLQAVYALTIHTSQGSTFSTAFLDVADIRRRAASNALECQQLCYVGATRPSRSLVLVGA